MAITLRHADADFEPRFAAFLAGKREDSPEVDATVRAIIADVRAHGDAALKALTKKFDRADLDAVGIGVERADIEAAYAVADPRTVESLAFARDRIERHHRRQMPKDERYVDPIGVELGWRWTAVDSVGLYVPGGLASYPSSVLMNAVPAKVVGPGNAYVAVAKRQVFGAVGIDSIAGPSEVLVVADRDNDPEWIAADLLAQAEHGMGAQSILVTDDAGFARQVEKAVERQLGTLASAAHAGASWRDFGALIVVEALDDALPLVDRIAAEHVELAFDGAETFFARMRNAGAVFIGRHTPEVIGDYVGGSNHVLPTARSARFSSGLSVLDFVKRTSLLKLGPEQLRALGPAAIALARAENLDGHAASVAIRLNLEG